MVENLILEFGYSSHKIQIASFLKKATSEQVQANIPQIQALLKMNGFTSQIMLSKNIPQTMEILKMEIK